MAYQSKAERSYDDGWQKGYSAAMTACVSVLFVIGGIIAFAYAGFVVHRNMEENSKAAFTSACTRAGGDTDDAADFCRANDPVGPNDWKDCLQGHIGKENYTEVSPDFFRNVANRCTDELTGRTGHIIMIRSEEGTWK